MIFVSLGTTQFKFPRLLQNINASFNKTDLNDNIIIQSGKTNYALDDRRTKVVSEIPLDELLHVLSRSRGVICHAGAGILLLSFRYAKVKPFVVPRLRKFHEHVDDHQVQLTTFLSKKGFICSARNDTTIQEDLRSYLLSPPKQEKRLFFLQEKNTRDFCDALEKETEDLMSL